MTKYLGSTTDPKSLVPKEYVDTAVSGRAPLASPAFTGTPTAPTASGTANTQQLATTAQVQSALSARITYGTTDLTAGTSPLATGVVYLVYE